MVSMPPSSNVAFTPHTIASAIRDRGHGEEAANRQHFIAADYLAAETETLLCTDAVYRCLVGLANNTSFSRVIVLNFLSPPRLK